MSQIKLKLKKGDQVVVISGSEKGKKGTIVRVDRNTSRVVVEGINMVKKHTKPSAANQEGGIIEKEAPIHISNLMFVEGETPTKIGRKLEGDKVVRYSKKSNNIIK
jgi:large subunit ribosomal protein L24